MDASARQGGHKPGILRDFSEHGKLIEFSENYAQPQGKLSLHSGCSLCLAIHTQRRVSGAQKLLIWAIWDERLLLVAWVVVDVVILMCTFCCNNLWKGIITAPQRPGKLRDFFLLLCGHPASTVLLCVKAVCVMTCQCTTSCVTTRPTTTKRSSTTRFITSWTSSAVFTTCRRSTSTSLVSTATHTIAAAIAAAADLADSICTKLSQITSWQCIPFTSLDVIWLWLR